MREIKKMTDNKRKNPIAIIKMENNGIIKIELYKNKVLNTVNNFIYLAKKGFYDGLIFHRVISNFMIQGGCPNSTGMGDPGYSIKGEFLSNGVKNDISHERGVVSMARSKHTDSAGSQFFIMTDKHTHLDGDYAAFGKIIEGMDVVDEIASVETDMNDKPLKDQKIKSIDIDLGKHSY